MLKQERFQLIGKGRKGERKRVTLSIVDQRALRGGNAASLYSRVSTTITNREYDMLMMVCNNCRLAAAVGRGAARQGTRQSVTAVAAAARLTTD